MYSNIGDRRLNIIDFIYIVPIILGSSDLFQNYGCTVYWSAFNLNPGAVKAYIRGSQFPEVIKYVTKCSILHTSSFRLENAAVRLCTIIGPHRGN